ncbi:MAG: helix-turn-helix domain-containing protein [Clostridia bacterium]|nr:helix-turn-helix domain-containing protein [Clostridia bacterium]MBQ8290367.1 helix-turn-helix domain-containing protein [Clostridia bacterium]
MTLEELADAIGTSKQTIHRYENGIISNIPADKVLKLAAALDVSPAELMGWDGEDFSSFNYNNVLPYSVKRIPMLGNIACGEPIFADEEHESFVNVGDGIDADFCLRASGDSMMGARIFDGDIVFIRKQEAVDNGEIAAVIINDEATLKRVYYYPSEEKIVLTPENPRYAPLVYIRDELDTIKILGKAVAFQSIVV